MAKASCDQRRRMEGGRGRGSVDRVGWVVGAGRAAASSAAGAALSLPGPQAGVGSGGAVRDPVCAAHGDRVAPPAPGAGLRRGRDLLEAAGCLAARRRVGEAARGAVGGVASGGRAGLEQGGRGFEPGAG